jgi:hypothetical protein
VGRLTPIVRAIGAKGATAQDYCERQKGKNDFAEIVLSEGHAT